MSARAEFERRVREVSASYAAGPAVIEERLAAIALELGVPREDVKLAEDGRTVQVRAPVDADRIMVTITAQPVRAEVERRCRDCGTVFLLSAKLAERPPTKWTSLCGGCIMWKV